jgi:hypothetical protein
MSNLRHLGRLPPAQIAISITPDDDADLSTTGVLLTCTGTGNAVVHDMDSNEVTIHLVAGAVFPLQVRRVLATDTAATGIVGLVV